MSLELGEAYKTLYAQWPGKVRRLVQPGNKGWPDFFLSHFGNVYLAEVKAIATRGLQIPVKPLQIATLKQLNYEGLNVFLLTRVCEEFWVVHSYFEYAAFYTHNADTFGCEATPYLFMGEGYV